VLSEGVSRVSTVLGHVRVRPRSTEVREKYPEELHKTFYHKKGTEGWLVGVVLSMVLCMYHLSLVLGGEAKLRERGSSAHLQLLGMDRALSAWGKHDTQVPVPTTGCHSVSPFSVG